MSASGRSSDPFGARPRRGERVAGLRVLQGGGRQGRSGGNVLLLDDTPGREALLKVYRRRGSSWREVSRRFSYRVLERKRGVTAEERCAVERAHLALWRARGFDVPELIDMTDRPLPPGVPRESALWMEYCPGPTLRRFLRDGTAPFAEREKAVERYGADLGARQGAALESGDRGLVMKHATTKHVLLHAGRQVSFDLEAAYAPGVPLLDALADELGAGARSLLAASPPEDWDALGEAFLRGYRRRGQLAEIADFGLRRGGISRAVRRLADRWRRRPFSEYDALLWIEARMRLKRSSPRPAAGPPAPGAGAGRSR